MNNEKFKHSFKNQIKENLGLAVYSTGYQKCESGYFWGPGIREHFLIHYISKGKGQLFSNGQQYDLVEGDIFIIFPSQIVSYKADLEDPWEYCWVGFQGTDAKRLISQTDLSKINPFAHINGNNRLKKLLLNIYKSSGNMPSNDITMLGFLYLFLGELVKTSEQEKVTRHTNHEYIEKALKYIEFNYTYPISVDNIAEYVGVSRSHLYRIFIKHTSMSPNEYLQKYRINESCVLIRKDKFSMGEVANSVGFTDPLYFSRVFKKIKGQSPTKYFKNAVLKEKENI